MTDLEPTSEEKALKDRYESLVAQLQGVIADEPDLIANLANAAACLATSSSFRWVGFYRKIGDSLVLGPFQGPPARARLALTSGCCGAAARERRTVSEIVERSSLALIGSFSGACAEIAVPLLQDGEVKLVLAAAADREGGFDFLDKSVLESVVAVLRRKYTI